MNYKGNAETPSIGAENPKGKVEIEQQVEHAKFKASTKEKLLTIIHGVGSETFGASKVMKLIGCKPTAATTLIKKLLSLEIIESVTGHGKGKYRVKR